MTENNIVAAIDGYSAGGKSTVAKAAAKLLKLVYVDSGAMQLPSIFRIMIWK